MQSIREIQAKTVPFLQDRGVPQAKLDTDLLIAEVLGLKRLELYLDLDRSLTEAQLDRLRPMVKRRANREPLQYILGYSEFCGMRLKVGPDVLIPRQETEELVELLRNRLARSPGRILDLGTGSGALALALAALYPEARVTATDRSAAALEVAGENAARYTSGSVIDFREGSWWDCVDADESFDLIVCNPPYLTEAELESAEPEVAGHEPRTALVAGPEGLDDLNEIIAGLREHLSHDGLAAMETGIAQHPALSELCVSAGLSIESVNDLSNRPRFVLLR